MTTDTQARPVGTEAVVRALVAARTRTSALTDFDDAELVCQVDPLMSPLVWDLAHIGQQEELWLLRHLAGRPALLAPAVDNLYDAFQHPRAERPSLPLLAADDSRRYLAQVRDLVLDGLERADPDVDSFTHGLVVQHEQQHVETMLATHQLRVRGPVLLDRGAALPAGRSVTLDTALIPAGGAQIGVDASTDPWSLDNERPAHRVHVATFRIGRLPVSNAQWASFIAAGGYDDARLWDPVGWAHRTEAGLSAPQFWTPDGAGGWLRSRFGVVEAVAPDEPVQHVNYWEADAYARWVGGRLPTEVEWEKACAWDPVTSRRRRWPWGDEPYSPQRANLDGAALRPAPLGAYPQGASAYGVEQMIGDVWEWTSSRLTPWPGFRPMVYDTYSAPFFGGDYRVLRGGSWAVGADAIRPSFRNWDLPIRRQIFTGVRVAFDVAADD